jgi:hypothetical protein
LARGDKLFFGAGRTLRRSLGVLAGVAALALVGAIAAPALGVNVAPKIVLDVAAAASAFAALWFLASLFRLHPARLCLLRSNVQYGGDRFTHDLRPYGHVIVYRDRDAKAPTARSVTSRLRNLLALNLRAMFCDRQTLTLDAARELTPLLAQAGDALIIDLSIGAPRDWDLLQPQASRCVFVSAWGQHEKAEAAFAALGLPGQCFFYAPDGEIQRRGLFRAALLEAMRRAHGA